MTLALLSLLVASNPAAVEAPWLPIGLSLSASGTGFQQAMLSVDAALFVTLGPRPRLTGGADPEEREGWRLQLGAGL